MQGRASGSSFATPGIAALLLASAAVLGGCATAVGPSPTAVAPSTCPAGGTTYARLELIFGATTGKRVIHDPEWKAFLAREVTPRFPDGLTTFDAYGQWRSARGKIEKLPSRVLLIWYKPSREAEASIQAIRDAYNTRYKQESVMRVDSQSCVSF